MDIKVGDMVRLKPVLVAKLGSINDMPTIRCILPGANSYAWISHDLVEEVLPRPLAVGDRVVSKDGRHVGTVAAICDVYAWVKADGSFGTYSLAGLTRLP